MQRLTDLYSGSLSSTAFASAQVVSCLIRRVSRSKCWKSSLARRLRFSSLANFSLALPASSSKKICLRATKQQVVHMSFPFSQHNCS